MMMIAAAVKAGTMMVRRRRVVVKAQVVRVGAAWVPLLALLWRWMRRVMMRSLVGLRASVSSCWRIFFFV